jgi:hypothetical protein
MTSKIDSLSQSKNLKIPSFKKILKKNLKNEVLLLLMLLMLLMLLAVRKPKPVKALSVQLWTNPMRTMDKSHANYGQIPC